MLSNQAAEPAHPRFVTENWPRVYNAKCVFGQWNLVGLRVLLRRNALGAVVIGWSLTCLTSRLRGSDGLVLALWQFDVVTCEIKSRQVIFMGGSNPRDRPPQAAKLQAWAFHRMLLGEQHPRSQVTVASKLVSLAPGPSKRRR